MCINHFHTLLYWEMDGGQFDLHHLMVLAYHLQHPSLMSPEWQTSGTDMLVQFVEQGVSPAEMRKRIAPLMDSGSRGFPIRGTEASHGGYAQPMAWTMTVADVVKCGSAYYYMSVSQWTTSILATLRECGHLA